MNALNLTAQHYVLMVFTVSVLGALVYLAYTKAINKVLFVLFLVSGTVNVAQVLGYTVISTKPIVQYAVEEGPTAATTQAATLPDAPKDTEGYKRIVASSFEEKK